MLLSGLGIHLNSEFLVHWLQYDSNFKLFSLFFFVISEVLQVLHELFLL